MSDNKDFLERSGSTLFSHPGLRDLLAMSSDVDGFKRENAVRRLGMLGDALAIPCLIVRANDWVPQVRAAAYDALIKLLKAGNGAAFIASLPEILHLQSCKRGDHSGLLQAVQEFLLREDNRPLLANGMHSSDPRIARLVTRLLVDRKLMNPAEVVKKGLAHKDVIVRSIVVDLLRTLGPDDFVPAVAEALGDRYMPVRREAFQQLLLRDPERGLIAARRFLFDSSAAIRAIAVARLLAVSEPVEEMYARALTGDRDRVAIVKCVLWGWGLMDSRSRVGQVQQLLQARYPSIRRAALQSITKLLHSDAKAHLETALADPSPAVCNEAARLINKLRVAPSVETLIATAMASRESHVTIACCRVIREGSKWDWLRFVLNVYGASGSVISQDAFSREIAMWDLHFNRSSAQLETRHLDEIVRLIRYTETKLSVDQVRMLKFTVRTFGAAG